MPVNDDAPAVGQGRGDGVAQAVEARAHFAGDDGNTGGPARAGAAKVALPF